LYKKAIKSKGEQRIGKEKKRGEIHKKKGGAEDRKREKGALRLLEALVASRRFLPCSEGMASEVEDEAGAGSPLVANGAADVRRRVGRRAAARLLGWRSIGFCCDFDFPFFGGVS